MLICTKYFYCLNFIANRGVQVLRLDESNEESTQQNKQSSLQANSLVPGCKILAIASVFKRKNLESFERFLLFVSFNILLFFLIAWGIFKSNFVLEQRVLEQTS